MATRREAQHAAPGVATGSPAGSGVCRVVLIGFMGAGKSTVGRLLAPLLGWRFVDADAVLAEQAGASIAELFRRHGEPWFRRQEAAAIAQALGEEHLVLALGGGAVEDAGTRALLTAMPSTLVVYLEAPLSVALARCASELGAAQRPLLEDAALLESRFHARIPIYPSAHFTLQTQDRTPAEVAASVRDFLLGAHD